MASEAWRHRAEMHARSIGYRIQISVLIVVMLLGLNESQGTAHYGEDSVGSFPYFEYNVPRNVTTVVGQTAFLHCRVEQLGDKAVIRPDKSENWTLQIKFPQERDGGIYECQVNTEPKMSLAFQLNVVEAKAHILGPADLYVKTGSSLALTCILSQGPHDLGTIFWYKGSNLIEYKELEANDIVEQPRIRLKTEWTEQLTSRLTVNKLLPTDSGNYSCVPTMAEAASVNVHVINGEHPAAMQHGNANTASPCALSVNLLISLYCTLATLYTSTVDGFR
ncbi:unnamed protein product [Leptosia nina]|uniref:Ig-like domain-containing protein n=1 Tax=Leptosia nina TaxID=320188 RepID=A0AAV1JGS4_9NEOP